MSIRAEERVNIEPGVWLLTEGLPNYFYYYKLISGKVSIYTGDQKLKEIELKEGDKPIVLGIFAALRKDRKPIASVRTETDVVACKIYIDQTLGILSKEIPKELKEEIATMIDSILLKNEIQMLEIKLKEMPKLKFTLPTDLRKDVSEIVEEISRLYEELVL